MEFEDEEEINIRFWFETRADHFSDEITALVSKIDLFLVWFGGESGSTKILRNLLGKNAKGGKSTLKT
ncbi:MAG: hypothetical protein ACFFAN_02795 [Promethearchaeota archaeon]